MPDHRTRPVFHDPKNLRWRWVRGALLALGALLSLAFGVATVSILVSPILPGLGLKSPRLLPGPGHILPPPRKPWVMDERERAFQRATIQLAASERKDAALHTPTPPMPKRSSVPEISAFYVNWDDTSFTSLKANLKALDKLTAEWLHLADAKGTVVVDEEDKVDLALAAIRPARPRMPVIALINNFRGVEASLVASQV